MKKISLIALIISFMLLSSCLQNNFEEKTTLKIDPVDIEQISISTQMTPTVQNRVLEKEEIKGVLDKLNSYTVKEINTEDEAGWEYFLTIEKKAGTQTLITFMDNKVKVDDKVYEVNGYKKDDFLYLFD
ncbi:hypothetical protein [Guggenheimella bovis]